MLLRGLGAALGGFGRSIIKRLQEIGQSVVSALRLAGVAGVEVGPAAVAQEWGEVSVATGLEENFAELAPSASVPVDWYEMSEIPWDKPICYTVAVYGRSRIKTKKYEAGQFARMEFNITVSRPLTSEEALDEAQTWLTGKDYSPMFDVFSIKLIGASRRLGEPWRW